jgi:septum site-determining protein MinD
MDEGLRCLDLMLGVSEELVFDLSDVLLGKPLEECVCTVKSKKFKTFHLLAAPSDTNKIDTFSFAAFAKDVSSIYDVVIFDFPAGIDFSLYSALPQDTTFLTVALPDPVSIRDASIVSEKLEEMEVPTRLILNCFDYKLTKKKIHKSIDDIIDDASLRLLGIIPRSKELSLLSINHKIKPRGKSMKAFTRIAKRLSGKQVLLPKLKKI